MNWIVTLFWRMSIRKRAINPGQDLPKKIYEVNPLTCPRCGGDMRIITPVEDCKVVKKILDYLKIYESQRKRPPPAKISHLDEFDCYIRDDYIDCDYMDI